MTCIAYRARTNTDWYIEYKCKKPIKTKKLFVSFSYYKLKVEEHFIHFVPALGSKGYEIGSMKEILD